jgi:putative endonuclease
VPWQHRRGVSAEGHALPIHGNILKREVPPAYNPAVPYVYILRCGDGSLYTGITTDLDRRLEQHHAGRASRYTRSRLPVALIWSCEVVSWSAALREERRIKAMRKTEKEEFLDSCPQPSS